MLSASLGGSVHGAALLWLQARGRRRGRGRGRVRVRGRGSGRGRGNCRFGSVHGAALQYLLACAGLAAELGTLATVISPPPTVLAGYHPTVLAGYHPHQACAGRAAELGELGAVEALAQVLRRALTLAFLTLALTLTLAPTLALAVTLRAGLTPRKCGPAAAGPRRVAGELVGYRAVAALRPRAQCETLGEI